MLKSILNGETRLLLIEFVLPAILLLGCLGLLFSGIDGEVKAILAVAAGWLFHSAATTKGK